MRDGPNLRDFFKDDHWPIKSIFLRKKLSLISVFPNKQMSEERSTWMYMFIYSKDNNFEPTKDIIEADVILVLTCAIRDSAEEKIWGRLDFLKGIKRARKKDRPSLKKTGAASPRML
ncbi:unnamed protein product, partial [Callosobruchus maculatus]